MLKKTKSLIIWIILGILGLSIFILFFDQTSPIASIDIRLSKEEALKRANTFVKEQGFDLAGYNQAIIFYYDYGASVYLQKTQGIKKSNELIRKGIPVWFWRIRYFKELQKKGFIVHIDPSSGEIVKFFYSLLDDEKGASLTELQAKKLAEEKIVIQNINLSDYELKDSTIKTQKARTDYYFDWEKKDFKIEEAPLRLRVEICGDELGGFKRYLKVPEEFKRYLEKETSLGEILTVISSILMFLLSIAAVILLIVKTKQIKTNWRWSFGAISASIVFPLEIAAFLNNLPLFWSFYPDTISKIMFFIMLLEKNLFFAFSVSVMIFAYGTVGDLISRDLWTTKTPLLNAIKNRAPLSREVFSIFIIGYSLSFIFLGFITLFYLVGTKFFGVWMPPETEYSNILGTYLPFLFPLTIALSAAVREEFMYRLFSISFFKKFTNLSWLAIIIPALLWGFGHSNYPIFPNYVRGIELTLFGSLLGVVFLKYGLETVIIAHFVINAFLAGLPLIKSHNLNFITSGIIVISLALLPLLVIIKPRRTI